MENTNIETDPFKVISETLLFFLDLFMIHLTFKNLSNVDIK